MKVYPPNYYHLPKQEATLNRHVQTVATLTQKQPKKNHRHSSSIFQLPAIYVNEVALTKKQLSRLEKTSKTLECSY